MKRIISVILTTIAICTVLSSCNLKNNSADSITLGGKNFDTNVTDIELQDTAISDINILAECKDLVSLTLVGCGLSDINVLKELPNLKYLDLRDNNISDITALSELTSLHSLSLSNNNIADISALSNLAQLESLDIGKNPVKDITPLIGMIKLEILYADETAGSCFPGSAGMVLQRFSGTDRRV